VSFVLLDAALVEAIHDEVLNAGELAGRARDKSLEGALARVEHRVAYGMIDDAFDLAAMYAVAIAMGHCFNDANKRTAFRAMNAALAMNGERHRLERRGGRPGDRGGRAGADGRGAAGGVAPAQGDGLRHGPAWAGGRCAGRRGGARVRSRQDRARPAGGDGKRQAGRRGAARGGAGPGGPGGAPSVEADAPGDGGPEGLPAGGEAPGRDGLH
jgi:death-on-curing protein